MTNSLEVSFLYMDEERAVWETHTLWGPELAFGHKVGEHFVPVRWTAVDHPLTDWEQHRARTALFCWGAGDWSRMVQLLADLAAGV